MTRNDHTKHKHPGHQTADHGRVSHHAQHAQHHRPPPNHAADRAAHSGAARRRWGGVRRGVVRFLRRPFLRRIFWTATITAALLVVGFLGLWWRLASGPIEFDLATPWLKSAIEENFGGSHTVSVGGAQLERDEDGSPSLRLRDIVVRAPDGSGVASAPKAEVGISGSALLHGQVRARSLSLVGAEMSVRIEKDGAVTVFAGADSAPIATAAPPPGITPGGTPSERADDKTTPGGAHAGLDDMAGILAWIDGLGATGLDGHDLRELGLKNGNLTVDDQRGGKHWTFKRINVSLMRPRQGGLTFRLASENPKQPWVINAAMRPLAGGVRAIGLEARNVSASDILLALRLNENEIEPDLPLSASVRAEVSAAGILQHLQGQVVSVGGKIIDHQEDKIVVPIDRADIRFNWEAQQRTLVVPLQLRSGGNQFTVRAALKAADDNSGVWLFSIARGDSVIDPIILGGSRDNDEEGIAFNRVSMHGRIDTVKRRIDLVQGDFSRVDTRPLYNIGIALTGSMDLSGKEPHLAFGVAGTRMPGNVLKRLWPIFATYPVRSWVDEHMHGGVVERLVIAGNAKLSEFRAGGPPMPDDGFSVEIETNGTTVQPLPSLPPIHDADLTVRIVGRHAKVSLGRGVVDVAGGRKLNVVDGVFDVPDVHPKPAKATAQFRVDGATPAMAALLTSDALRGNIGALTLDPGTTHGTVDAEVAVNMLIGRNVSKDAATYAITADLTNFAADKMLAGDKVEASSLKVTASNDGYEIKGNVKVNNMPSTIVLEKKKGDRNAQLQLQAKLDEVSRRKFGIDAGDAITGTIPIKITGEITDDPKDSKFKVVADFTSVKLDNLLPGWQKASGKSAHATFLLSKTPKLVRLENMEIEGSGANVRGSLELDNTGEIQAANFPVFALSSGDKASIKADRGPDDVLHVVMRGDVYDGRNFVKASMAGNDKEERKGKKETDLDLDIKLGAVAGHNGETLRGLNLRLSRRNGRIRSFSMKSKIGRDTPLNGDLRLRSSDNHEVVYFETNDAGALFRFTDMYPRMFGGKMWVAMDPPAQHQKRQIGTLYITDFAVRGEPALQRVVAGAPGQARGSVQFSEMRADFTRFPGRMSIRNGIVRGPAVGVTVEGNIDYVKNDVHLRGTFVPFYGLNNIFGQIPIVGLILGGGSNEGLLGITYEATGPPSAPNILVNPVSAIAPGLLRKFIPSPGSFDPKFIPRRE
jgi:hypothetical protein